MRPQVDTASRTALDDRSPAPTAGYSLPITLFDRIVSWLMATLCLVSIAVALLFGNWLVASLNWGPQNLVVRGWDEGADIAAPNAAQEWEAPSDEELPREIEASIHASLAAISHFSQVSAVLEAREAAASGVGSLLQGHPNGVHDVRQVGPPAAPPVPEWERWEIHFASSSLDEYRKQLDFFGVELAAFGGADTIDYARHFTGGMPTIRQESDPASESRMRFSWKRGPLLAYDRQLLEEAGIDTRQRVVCQFYDAAMRRQLLALEASGGDPARCLKTVFGVRRKGGVQKVDYEFYVISQVFRDEP